MPAEGAPRRPNIVLILADDVGFGDIGCYNPDTRIPTPRIDALARGGMVFTDAHSASAVCTPSRYSLLTGRYCWRGPLKRSVLYGYEPPLIEPTRSTLASVLKHAGYRTGCVGKWHLGLGYTARAGATIDFTRPLPWPEADRAFEEVIDFRAPISGGPVELGFETFFGTSGCSTCQPPYGFIEGDRFVDPPEQYLSVFPYTGRPGMASPGWSHADVDPEFARRAVRFVRDRAGDGRPFFLYLAPSACHEPCVDEVVPAFARSRSGAGPRGDLVWLFDWMVGQVVDAVAAAGQIGNTLFIVTSDNGALPGDRLEGPDGVDTYRLWDHQSCGNWRGYKSHIWEGGHREPLVMSWPGVVPAGSRCDGLVCLSDLPATLAALTGTEVPRGAAEDSRNILPLLEGRSPAAPPRVSLVHHSVAGVFSLRHLDWKLVHESTGSGGWPPPAGPGPVPGSTGQLYDLREDPGETRNLYAERPAVVRDLTELLRETQSDPAPQRK